MQRPGPGPQGLRAMPGNVFANQTSATNRMTPLGGGRLQNGKLGGNASASANWAFGGIMGGNPGTNTNLNANTNTNTSSSTGTNTNTALTGQSRVNSGPSGGLASFAQTIGGAGNQPPIDLSRRRKKRAAKQKNKKTFLDLGPAEESEFYEEIDDSDLDLSIASHSAGARRGGLHLDAGIHSHHDFPSLSGAPPQQHQQHAQAQSLWSNASIRNNQQTPIQRQHQTQGAQQQAQHQQSVNAQQQVQDDGPSFGQSNGDDYGFGGPGGLGGLTGLSQAPSNTVDDFPPLSGLGSTDVGQDRRTGMIQNAAFGGGGQGSRFAGLSQSRLGLTSPESQQDTGLSRLGGSRIASGESNGMQQRPAPGFEHTQQQQQQQQQSVGSNGDFQRATTDIDLANVANSQISQAGRKRLADMTEFDRWSIAGLLAMIPSESADHSSLAVGQDLTILGLDLNRPDNSPLYPTFGSPFGDRTSNDPNAPTRPVVPDYKHQIPPSYGVTNVPPLQSKMSSFHEETLLAIFYQYTRDIMQEYAAQELYKRDWRWHKRLRQWMMKDPNPPHGWPNQPQQIDSKSERGFYVFFDVNSWRKERKELILNYDDLDQRHGSSAELQQQSGL